MQTVPKLLAVAPTAMKAQEAEPDADVDAATPADPPAREEPATPEDPDAYKRSFVGLGIAWLAKHQNEDGSWGDGPALLEGQHLGRSGVTAMVLLAMLGAGYSHLSKDVYDGTNIGDSIRRALKWLLKDQHSDGSFESGPGGLDQALLAYALSDAYGLTASGPLKEPAARALDALIRKQFPDGSWGPMATSAAALMALNSGELSELDIDAEVRTRALQYAGSCPHPGMIGARILMTKDKNSVESAVAALVEAPPAPYDYAGWLHASTGIFLADGVEGSRWKEWRRAMWQVTDQTHARDGSWPAGTGSATIVRTSLAIQMLALPWRYPQK